MEAFRVHNKLLGNRVCHLQTRSLVKKLGTNAAKSVKKKSFSTGFSPFCIAELPTPRENGCFFSARVLGLDSGRVTSFAWRAPNAWLKPIISGTQPLPRVN